MILKILETKDNKLLSRKEYFLEAEFKDKTPSTEEFLKKISETLKAKPELIKLKKIIPIFGERKVKIIVYQYNTVKDLKAIEKEKIKKKKQEKPKEEPKKEAPKKEELKKEEKPKDTKEEVKHGKESKTKEQKTK